MLIKNWSCRRIVKRHFEVNINNYTFDAWNKTTHKTLNMKSLILLLFFMSIGSCSFAQYFGFPDGVYLTHEQFRSKTPAFNTELKTIVRSSTEIFVNGGNLYKFESVSDSLDSDYIKNKIYAYVKNDSVFINCKHQKLQSWYVLAISFGNFVTFYSCVSTGKMILNSVGIGAIGGGLGGAIMASNSNGYHDWHVLSLRTGNSRVLNKDYIKRRLKEHPDLLYEFEQEKLQKYQNYIEILLKYIDKLNLITDPFSDAPIINE